MLQKQMHEGDFIFKVTVGRNRTGFLWPLHTDLEAAPSSCRGSKCLCRSPALRTVRAEQSSSSDSCVLRPGSCTEAAPTIPQTLQRFEERGSVIKNSRGSVKADKYASVVQLSHLAPAPVRPVPSLSGLHLLSSCLSLL